MFINSPQPFSWAALQGASNASLPFPPQQFPLPQPVPQQDPRLTQQQMLANRRAFIANRGGAPVQGQTFGNVPTGLPNLQMPGANLYPGPGAPYGGGFGGGVGGGFTGGGFVGNVPSGSRFARPGPSLNLRGRDQNIENLRRQSASRFSRPDPSQARNRSIQRSLAARDQLGEDLVQSIRDSIDEANQANEDRYEEGLANNTARGERLTEGLSAARRRATSAAPIEGRDAGAGFAELRGRVLQGIEGLGGTERRAIADRANVARADAEQGLTQRGLGNTTIRSSVRSGIADRESRQVSDLEERLLERRIAADSDITTQRLNAEERESQFARGLADGRRSDELRANLQLDTLGLQLQDQIGRDRTGFIERRNDPVPDASQYLPLLQQMGFNDPALVASLLGLTQSEETGGESGRRVSARSLRRGLGRV